AAPCYRKAQVSSRPQVLQPRHYFSRRWRASAPAENAHWHHSDGLRATYAAEAQPPKTSAVACRGLPAQYLHRWNWDRSRSPADTPFQLPRDVAFRAGNRPADEAQDLLDRRALPVEKPRAPVRGFETEDRSRAPSTRACAPALVQTWVLILWPRVNTAPPRAARLPRKPDPGSDWTRILPAWRPPTFGKQR